jgi:quercetin dioxygenase-like cupin family protein
MKRLLDTVHEGEYHCGRKEFDEGANMRVVKISNVPKEPFISSLFTGENVTKQALIPESNEYDINNVNFSSDVRLKWHAHDCEQILIVTSGQGVVATEKEQKAVTVGDVIFIPEGEKHWHGANGESEFSHIFIYKKGSKYTQLEE